MAQGLDGASLRIAGHGNVAIAENLCRRILDSKHEPGRQELVATVIGTPGCSAQDCIEIVSLTATFIVKIPRKHTLATREAASTEARWASWASDLGISPRVLLVDEETGGLVIEFIHGRTLESHQTYANIEQLVEILRKLHCQKPRSWMKASKDPAASVEEVLQTVQDRNELDANNAELLRRVVSIAKSALSKIEPESTPCHNDFHTENVLLDRQNKIWCIDFECAGLSDPMWDLAYLAASIDSVDLKQLAEMYGATKKQQKRLSFFYCLTLAQTILWYAMNGSVGIELRDAYLGRLERHMDDLSCGVVRYPA